MSEDIAVHCKTEEEWEAVKKRLKSKGINACSHDFYGALKQCNSSGVCLAIPSGWCDTSYYRDEGYTIIPASEYLGEFKVGDRVECINACIGGMIEGDIYTVERLGEEETPWLMLKELGDDQFYKPDRFRKFRELSANQPKTTKKEESMSDQNVIFESNIYEVFKADPEMMEKVNKRFAGQYATADDRTLIALRNDKTKLIAIIKKEEEEEKAAEKAAKTKK